jgi:hypothetical protein
MESQDIEFNRNSYNVFSICEEFRQRLAQLQRLKDPVVKETTEE